MCGSIPPSSSANHASGKAPGPIMTALGGLVLVVVFCFSLVVDWLRRSG